MNCEICKKRKAVIRFSEEPVFAMTHGVGVTNMCRQCYLKELEDTKSDLEENIQIQKKLLGIGQMMAQLLEQEIYCESGKLKHLINDKKLEKFIKGL